MSLEPRTRMLSIGIQSGDSLVTNKTAAVHQNWKQKLTTGGRLKIKKI